MFGFELKRRPVVKRSMVTEPINIVTGAQGAGKTLWAIEQSDLLRVAGDAEQVYQIGINEPDLRKLPALPFPFQEWHLRADAGELKNAVIIVDEFHELMPQRSQNSSVPAHVEQMAQARKRDIRFVLLTQSTEFDHFLKGTRCNRHFYISRKSGFGRATVYEWMNRFVSNPEDNKDARQVAIKHLWRHPWKKYRDWYVSAKDHRFRVRMPLRLALVPVFLAFAVYAIYSLFGSLGPVLKSTTGATVASSTSSPKPAFWQPDDASLKPPVVEDVAASSVEYLERFVPVSPAMPWTAPAYRDRAITVEPDIICFVAERDSGDSCRCVTEQVTPLDVDDAKCRTIARSGIYNPYRRSSFPIAQGSVPDGKGLSGPRPADGLSVPVYSDVQTGAVGASTAGFTSQQAHYGQMRSP